MERNTVLNLQIMSRKLSGKKVIKDHNKQLIDIKVESFKILISFLTIHSFSCVIGY